ncbi:unnamed protein product [Rangifer tarandus platyrhynchus]|uniref:Uncharacterized protein n=2 Tax=Rangifer tarandus platyrhynchus TaxID=3082113 RepID=A0ABN8YM94_RANTA|nr:unnamed protein product [Rangifer tarandus platyrhynchus]
MNFPVSSLYDGGLVQTSLAELPQPRLTGELTDRKGCSIPAVADEKTGTQTKRRKEPHLAEGTERESKNADVGGAWVFPRPVVLKLLWTTKQEGEKAVITRPHFYFVKVTGFSSPPGAHASHLLSAFREQSSELSTAL